MKMVRGVAALAALLLLTAPVIAADFGVRAGRYQDARETFVGAELLIDLGSLHLNPNIEYSLADDVTAGSANLDVTFDILQFARAVPYVGVGLGLAYFDDDFSSSRTDAVGNLIGGVSFDVGRLNPYVQIKYFRVLDEQNARRDDYALTAGLRF